MNKRTFVIVLLVAVLLIATVGTAYAANPTKTVSACYTRLIGGGLQKVCFKTTYEYTGGSVRVKSKWYTQSTSGGYYYKNLGMSSYPSGWTSGWAGGALYWSLKRPDGSTVTSGSCYTQADARNGSLVIQKGC